MKMNFKTNMKCDGCLEKAKPFLDSDNSIKTWSVDLSSPEKTLTVEMDSEDKAHVIDLLAKAGFKAEHKS